MGLFDKLFGKNDLPKIQIDGKTYEVDQSSLVYSQIGLDKYNTDDFEGAIEAFTLALKSNASNQNLYVWRGTAYEDMGNDLAAERDFVKAINIHPDFLSMYRYGMLQYRKKNLNEAINWLKKAYNDFPDFINRDMGIGSNNILYVGKHVICANLGSFLLQDDQFDESLKYSREAIAIDPKYPNPLVNIGVALFKKGNPNEAIPYVREAAKLGYEKAVSVLEAIEQSVAEKKEEPADLRFIFKSSDHIRKQNGVVVSGPHGGAPRAIKVEPNMRRDAYTVTIFNLEGPHPIWQNNVQMAPKQMKIVQIDNQSIVLRGYGRDANGGSFADYGLIIHLQAGEIKACTLNMLDRGVDISYYA